MNPSVSVIIPFYNEISWLREAVDSVLAQTYPIKEIIVVNDGSKENLNTFLNDYKKKIMYIYKENGGPATARNLGIEKSTGDFIAFLDSDDIWYSNKIEFQIHQMLRHQAVWSHTSYELFNSDLQDFNSLKEINVKKTSGMIYPEMLFSNSLATPTIIIQGELLRNNDNFRFNNEMRYGQDQYLWLSIATEYKILAIEDVLVKVRIRGNNAALRARVQIRARATIWDTLRLNKEKFKVKNLPLTLKIAFTMSKAGTDILSIFEKVIPRNTFLLEIISKFLFLIPWLMFKIGHKFYSFKSEKRNE